MGVCHILCLSLRDAWHARVAKLEASAVSRERQEHDDLTQLSLLAQESQAHISHPHTWMNQVDSPGSSPGAPAAAQCWRLCALARPSGRLCRHRLRSPAGQSAHARIRVTDAPTHRRGLLPRVDATCTELMPPCRTASADPRPYEEGQRGATCPSNVISCRTMAIVSSICHLCAAIRLSSSSRILPSPQVTSA